MSDSTHVRVSLETRERVRREVGALIAAIDAGHMDAPDCYEPDQINPRCAGISFDAMLVMLLDDRDRHRKRRKKAKRRAETEEAALHQLIDLAAFDEAWEALSRQGRCDGLGGAEYKRVRYEYLLACPVADVLAFCNARANHRGSGRASF